jgi:hypothetical protein
LDIAPQLKIEMSAFFHLDTRANWLVPSSFQVFISRHIVMELFPFSGFDNSANIGKLW